MKNMKKFMALGLAATMAVTAVGCGGGSGESKETEKPAATENNAGDESTGGDATTSDGEAGDAGEKTWPVAMNEIELGKDFTDVKAELKVLTHRTDLAETVFNDYAAKFNELYPNITITYEGATDYAESITTRLTTKDWGDICMIPTTVDKKELPNLFVSFGETESLANNYVMLNNFSYEGQCYGIPSVGNAQGVVYNKKVFEEAGVTSIPKTPDEFLDALQKIKDNTDAIPMYTNFAAGWTMSAWDAYIAGSATGDPNFTNEGLVHGSNPFAKRDDMTGPYAVYYVLYEAVARGLVEDDPVTSDWEGSKGMINRGEIGAMVLGSWAVVQMQEAGDNADDIGYMPFPITVDGKQYASAGPDYCYGINKNASEENQIASMLYVKWLTEQSNFAFDQGGIPIVKGAKYPAVLDAFEGVELVIDNPAAAGEEDFYNNVNNESELGLNADATPKSAIVEHALSGDMTLDEIMDEWNQKWTAAQEAEGVEIR